jgi:uncharacterized protein (DUF1501 family)
VVTEEPDAGAEHDRDHADGQRIGQAGCQSLAGELPGGQMLRPTLQAKAAHRAYAAGARIAVGESAGG